MDKSFKPSEELKKFMERARQKESNMMKQQNLQCQKLIGVKLENMICVIFRFVK